MGPTNPSGLSLIGSAYELEVFSGSDKEINTFKTPVTVTLSYDSAGLSEGDLNKLGVYYLDESKGCWVFAGGKLDKSGKTVSAKVKHFTKFALLKYDKKFNDVNSHWAKADIEYVAARYIVSGVNADQFKPDSDVTRAQFSVMLVQALGLDTSAPGAMDFTDVKPGDWYYNAVAAAVKAGIIAGYDAKTFAPNAKITREQMAVMISKALSLSAAGTSLDGTQADEQLSGFTDKTGISTWAKNGVAKAVKEGIITGRTASTFVPAANATRAEAAVMIKKFIES